MRELNSDFDSYSGPAALWKVPPYYRGNNGSRSTLLSANPSG